MRSNAATHGCIGSPCIICHPEAKRAVQRLSTCAGGCCYHSERDPSCHNFETPKTVMRCCRCRGTGGWPDIKHVKTQGIPWIY